MKEQEYLLKKFVKARSAALALAMDRDTEVTEVYLVADKPDKESNVYAAGFQGPEPSFPYEY